MGKEIEKKQDKDLIFDKDLEKYFIYLNNKIEDLKKTRDEIRRIIHKSMKENNIRSLETEKMKLYIVDEGTVEKFDKAKFRKENKPLYDKYTHIEKRAEYLVIKGKDNESEDSEISD